MSWNDERDTIRSRMVVPEESAALASGKAIGLVKRLLYNGVAPQQAAAVAPTLINGWVNSGGTYAPVAYQMEPGGWVTVRGVVNGGTPGTAAFILPVGYRPVGDLPFAGWISTGFGLLFVQASSGGVFPAGAGVDASFAGIRFKAA